MKSNVRRLTQTTAIALGLMVTQNAQAVAQPFDELSGLTLPSCSFGGASVDAGTLGPKAFGKEKNITPEIVIDANTRKEVCLNEEGELQFRGESAALIGADDGALTSGTLGQALADAASGSADAATGEVSEAPAESDTQNTTAVWAEQPAVEGEVAAEAGQTSTQEGETAAVEQPAVSDDGRTAVEVQPDTQSVEQDAGTSTKVWGQGDTAQSGEAAPMQENPVDEQPPAALAAGADTNGREAEPADVTETTVTEENSRSSSEEFQTNAQGKATVQSGNGKSGGLSNFEKFALGAAGIVALDAIIGSNREVVSNSGDRVVTRNSSGDLEVLRDDDTLLRRPGADVRTETFSDGSTRTTVTRPNGAKIVTIADAAGRVIKRTRITADGREIVIIDDTEEVRPVDVTRLPAPPQQRQTFEARDRQTLEAALRAKSRSEVNRSFTLRQVREYRQVRDLMPEISIDAINFATASAAILPQEAEELYDLGQAMSEFIAENPDELFLIEGHTDAVGDAAYNLALSDRRAESVALALAEYFQVPPENMIIQGYGESELLIQTSDAERANRRAVVRRITPLLR